MRRLVVLGAVGVTGLTLAVVALPFILDLAACSAAERRVFAEVPHFGGVRLRPSGSADAGSCMATYRAPAPEDRVLAWYRQALRARGWTLQPVRAAGGRDAQGRELWTGELRARRGGDTYAVLYEAGPALQGGGTHVAVHAARD